MDRSTERTLKASVREEVASRLRAGQASPSAVEALIREVVGQVAFEQGEPLSLYELESLAGGIVDDFLRYGPLQPLLDDPAVTEIMVNGGGVDEADVWKKLEALQQTYQLVYDEQAAYYQALLDERDQALSRLMARKSGGDAHG